MDLKNLKNKSKNELIKICKKKNIKGYSKFNKNELIKHMKTYTKKGSAIKKFMTNEELKDTVDIYYKRKYNNNNFLSREIIRAKYGEIEEWDVSNITDMSFLFSNKTKFNEDISKWDTKNVTNMNSMFYEANSFNQPIGEWDTKNVINMNSMFYKASSFNQTIGSWNTSNVTDMNGMFGYATSFNQTIGEWDTHNVTTMYIMFFYATSFNQTIGEWDTKNVTNMEGMFYQANSFNQPIGKWVTEKVTTMWFMFTYATSFNMPIGSWNTKNVTNMDSMFSGATSFNQPISTWDTKNVINMNRMFENATYFNQPIGSWNTKNVKNMDSMFSEATSFNMPIGAWDTSNVTNMHSMFQNATSFNQPIGTWDTKNVINMNSMFYKASSFNQPIGKWVTENVTTMWFMFGYATSFNQPIGTWNISNVTKMELMFYDATSMQIQNINEWQQKLNPNANIQNIELLFRERTSNNSKILITKNMLSSNNNTCNTKLYDMLLKINLDDLPTKKFKFEEKSGIDAGGLSRTVFDLFHKTYLNKFFELHDNFYILKKNIEKKKFIKATNILVVLSEKAKVSIILPINPELIKFLKNENNNTVKEYNNLINLNKKNNYVKRNGINLTNQNEVRKLYMNSKLELTDVMANALNKHNKNYKNYKFENIIVANKNNNDISKSIIKKVYLRIYIKKFGFESEQQFIDMMTFMEIFYFKKDFKSEISFKKEDFFKRIKIIKPGETSNKAINISNAMKNNNLMTNYPNLKLLLDYINQEDDIYRENFNIWITGSKYSDAILKLFVNTERHNSPYQVATCFNFVNIYKTDKISNMNNNNLLKILSNNIKNNIKNYTFSTK